MADRKPSDIASLLGEIAGLVGAVQVGGDLFTAAARLVAEHYRYWLDQQARSNAPIDSQNETWDRLVAAKDQIDLIAGNVGSVRGGSSAADLLNALHSATSASAVLAGDLPGDRQTDPPPPTR